MVLPEVIRRLVPIAAIIHLIALRRISIRITHRFLLQGRDDQLLIKRVILAQTLVPHIFVGLDACPLTIGSIHNAQVVGTCGDTVPSLTRLLKVADILITYLILIAYPRKTTIVTTATA